MTSTAERHGGTEERLGGGLFTGRAQVDIDQIAVGVDGPVQVLPLPGDLQVRLIHVPVPADFALAPFAQGPGEQLRQLGFPVAHRLVREDQPAQQQDFCQVAQAELHPEALQHNKKGHIGGDLQPVQQRARALVELASAPAAAEVPVPVGRAV
ncbi:hypothetical protein M5E06_35275 [Azospirillum sp. A1-3]|nr:hypothetical protein [Azospirillum sp. A1-3]MCM8739339.1 hypothetical protein [Azospirillum sp. A1-3]